MTKKILALALGLVLALSGAASAQIATGNMYGIAKDESGAVLPGVNATLTSEFGTRTTVTGPDGAFRFLSLDKGDYTVTLSLAGFASTVRKIRITTGENVAARVRDEGLGRRRDRRGPGRDAARRQQAPRHRHHDDQRRAVEDPERARPLGRPPGRPGRHGRPRQHRRQRERPAGDVIVEGPAERGEHLEPGRHGDHRHVRHGRVADLLRLRRVPGDQRHDRRNRPVDGDGRRRHQPRRRGAARTPSTAARATWSPTRACPSATSTTRHQAPYTPNRARHRPAAAQLRRHATATRATASTTIKDYGFDLGGPIIKDKLWFYGSYGKQDIKLLRLTNTPDDTLLPSYNGKLNWQASSNTMVSAFYFLGSKQKFGRSPGSGLSRRTTASCGTRTTPTPTAACRAASGSCRSTTPSRPTCSSR